MHALPRVASLLLLVLFTAAPARADVVDAGPAGFTIRTSSDLAAIPKAAYVAFIVWVGSWWDAAQTVSGESRNLSIDARVGGCFCERLPNGGSVQHMTIVLLQPERTIRMVGAIGPLQELAAIGTMTWSFTPTSSATRVEMTYAVAGYAKEGLVPVARSIDAALTEQVRRFKRFVEVGMPR